LDDALLFTPGGFVAETAIWSVLWWEDRQLCGPAFDLGILPGVGRARVTELTGQVEERHATVRDLQGAPLVLVNAVRGLVPVGSLDGVPVPQSRETEALARRFWP
jgi:branched-subunit amino acid aminotransferase/4-amino-4-deoxychorismate lyase